MKDNVKISAVSHLNHTESSFHTVPYPWSVGDEFEDALEGEAHGEGEVHVAQDVGEEQRGTVVLNENVKWREARQAFGHEMLLYIPSS